jgi:hypothetical protein
MINETQQKVKLAHGKYIDILTMGTVHINSVEGILVKPDVVQITVDNNIYLLETKLSDYTKIK